jgi:hypothetical protein
MSTAKYFATCNGATVELASPYYEDIRIAARKTHSILAGRQVRELNLIALGYCPLCNGNVQHHAERVIFRKANPSNHKCDARCMHAKGRNCECSCKGENHGAAA